jgi:tRNA A-37 threonylcarbamoyl transferase component Bud32
MEKTKQNKTSMKVFDASKLKFQSESESESVSIPKLETSIPNTKMETLMSSIIPDKYKNDAFIVKTNVSENEVTVQELLYNLKHPCIHVPKIYLYNKEHNIVVMRKIPQMSLADMYGEDYEELPDTIKTRIHESVSLMYYNNIQYNDITGYNFIYHQKKLWVIDFEHASYDIHNHMKSSFMKDFVEGKVKGWNPEFL